MKFLMKISYRPANERSSSGFFSIPDPFVHVTFGAKLIA